MSEEKRNEKSSDDGATHHQPPDISISVTAVGLQHPKADTANKNNEKNSGTKRDVLDWATFGAALVAAIAAGFLAVDTHSTLIDAKDQFASANRAAISLKGVKITPITQNGKMVWYLGSIWENSGNSPTIGAKTITTWAIQPNPLNSGFTRCSFISEDDQRIPIGSHSSGFIQNVSIDPAYINNFIKGAPEVFYIWGRFDYRDIITQKSHSTRYCWNIISIQDPGDKPTSDLKFTYELCGEGNCIDDECKDEDATKYSIPLTPGGCRMSLVPYPNVPANPKQPPTNH